LRPRLLAWPRAAESAAREVTLDPDQARHGLRVLRLTEGAKVVLTSPWCLAPAVVVKADRRREILTLSLTGSFQTVPTNGPTLALALVRPSRFDLAVAKAVELGAAALWPVVAARCRAQDPSPNQVDRWIRLAEEASKQCARGYPINIEKILTWPKFLALAENFSGPRLFLEPNGQPWPDLKSDPLLLVGPEGGLTQEEKDSLASLGFNPLTLGPLVLRTETAALAALAQWRIAPKG
jgi:16S rRNA (uracil1498-N3)-methyltransferase